MENISLDKRTDFVAKLSEDKKLEQKVGEHLVIILDRIDDLNKPLILAKIFAAYINKEIDYEMFLRLSSVLDKAFLPDLRMLKHFKKLTGYSITTITLVTLGLVDIRVIGGGDFTKDADQSGGTRYLITPLGEIFLSILDDY